MNLLEYEAKQALSKHEIPVPKGKVAAGPDEVAQAATKIKPPYMIKSQVLTGGRGKVGGVISANSILEAKQVAATLLGMQIKGIDVKQVLIEEELSIRKELYASVTIDRANRCYIVLASQMGGMDIEEVAEKSPKAIFRTTVDSQLGLRSFHAIYIAKQLGYSGSQLLELSTIFQRLYNCCVETDAELVEVNPLVETNTGFFVAADARITIDDNALFRQPKYLKRETSELSFQEKLAQKYSLAYVKLEGDIGVVGNGAGLVMATLDLLNLFGGKPADFLDLGGGATADAVMAALEIVLSNSDAKSVIVNVLGGITHCDEVAKGIVNALKRSKERKPLAVRLIGTNQREGEKILADAGIKFFGNMEEAAEEAVKLAAGAKH